jgi:hypothetical protein
MITAAALALATFFASAPCEDKAPSASEFSCRVVLSDDVTLEDRWEHTLGGGGVQMAATDQVVRGQLFKVFVFFTNATLDPKGNADVRTDITILRPDGEVYHQIADMEAYQRRAPAGGVHLVEKMLAISFDPPDPLGKYTVRVVARDARGNHESKGEDTIELVESIDGETFGEGDEAVNAAIAWSMSVEAALEPHRLIHAFEAVAGAGLLVDGPRGTPLRTFFREAFDAHPFLFRALGELAADKETEESVRDAALLILATGRTDEKRRLGVLPEDVRKACEPFAKTDVWDPRSDAITEPGHLDQLWGTFFATGSSQAVARITEMLDRDPQGEKSDAMLHGAARWSLDSIAEQNELAAAYLAYLAAHPKTPAARKAILKEILED